MSRPLTLDDLAAVNGQPFGTQCRAEPPAGEPEQAPPTQQAPCAPPRVTGLTPCQRIMATEDCWAALGHMVRNGYALGGDGLAVSIGVWTILHMSPPGSDALWERVKKLVGQAGPSAGFAALPAMWSVCAPLMQVPADRALDLRAAKALVDHISSLALAWSRAGAAAIHGGDTFSGSLGI